MYHRVVPALLSVIALAACNKSALSPSTGPAPWSPGVAYATPRMPTVRGYLELRGLVHEDPAHRPRRRRAQGAD
jgi:hypothetical protein